MMTSLNNNNNSKEYNFPTNMLNWIKELKIYHSTFHLKKRNIYRKNLQIKGI
jgi:hypothetical protein